MAGKRERSKERFSAVEIVKLAAEKPAKTTLHHDGGGLYLCVDKRTESANWVYRYTFQGKARTMGLGPYPGVSLAKAREKAAAAREVKLDGKDPLEAKAAKKAAEAAEEAARRLERARAMTFRQCARAYIAAHGAGWTNDKHAAQWSATLSTYAYGLIGDLPVGAVDTALVIKILEPHWASKTETMSRLRQRIEAILDWAKVRDYRSGENPARWKGHLDKLLAARSKVSKVTHHAALPFAKVGKFMASLRLQEGASARALEFAILTAARTGEVLGACWGEIDLANKVWIVPADRMKAGREHRVPLAADAVTLLEAIKPKETKPDAVVFANSRTGKALSNMALLMLLRRMGHDDLTTHGFRSTFRDWCAEATSFPSEVAEMALAHAVGDKVEAAYRRGDLFERRRALADAWAKYCAARSADNVSDFSKRGAA